jgi:hypothetical protein
VQQSQPSVKVQRRQTGSLPAYLKEPHSERRQARTKTKRSVRH